MEQNTETKPAPRPDPSTAPFMDVAPPRPNAPAPTPPTAETTTPAESDAPKEPPADPDNQGDEPEQLINEAAAKPAPPRSAKKPKAPSDGTGMIIFVTFLVMVVLAGLAIYAYSQSK